MQAEEIVFDVTSESHNLEFNKSGGYHAYPKHNRKDFYFLKSNQDLIKQGISMDIFNVKLELTESDILKYFKNKFMLKLITIFNYHKFIHINKWILQQAAQAK